MFFGHVLALVFSLPWDQNTRVPKCIASEIYETQLGSSKCRFASHDRRWSTLPFRSSCRLWSWRKNLLAEGQSGWSLTKWLHGRHQSLSRTSRTPVATLGDPLWWSMMWLMYVDVQTKSPQKKCLKLILDWQILTIGSDTSAAVCHISFYDLSQQLAGTAWPHVFSKSGEPMILWYFMAIFSHVGNQGTKNHLMDQAHFLMTLTLRSFLVPDHPEASFSASAARSNSSAWDIAIWNNWRFTFRPSTKSPQMSGVNHTQMVIIGLPTWNPSFRGVFTKLVEDILL